MAEMDVQRKKGAPSLRQALGAKGVTPTPDGAPQTSPSMPAGPGSSSSNGQRLPPQVDGGPQPVPSTPGGGRMPAGNAGPSQKYGGYVPGGGGFLPNDPNDPRSKGSPFSAGGGVRPGGGSSGGIRYLGPPIQVPGPRPQIPPSSPGPMAIGVAGNAGNAWQQWKQRQQQPQPMPWGGNPGQGWVLDPTWGGGQRPISQPPMGMTRYSGRIPIEDTDPQQLPQGGMAY